MSTHVEPLKYARVFSLAMAWATATVSGCLGLYSLIKTNQIEAMLRKASAPAVLTFNIHPMFLAGLILTIGTTILATGASNIIPLFFFPFLRRGSTPLSTRTLPLQKWFLAFMSIWITANMIAFTYVFATDQVETTATLGPLVIPPAIIQAAALQMGVQSIYRRVYYLRWSEIFNWFTVVFAWIATIVTAKACQQANLQTEATERSSAESSAATSSTLEKAGTEKAEAPVMTENVDA